MHQHKTIRVVFFGTPEFAIPSLRALFNDARFSVTEVVTRPDEPAGRGMQSTSPAIKNEAERLGLTVFQPESLSGTETIDYLMTPNANACEHLRGLNADVFVVVAYGRILPERVLDLPPHGIINVHPSLLPMYRGPSPIQTAILNGDAISGVSVILLKSGPVDAGPLLAQQSCPVPDGATYATFSAELAEIAANLLPSTIIAYVSGTGIPQPQDETHATSTKRITREDGKLDYTQSAEDLERRIRAFTPWPGTYITFRGKRLKILIAHIDGGSFIEQPGTIKLYNKTPVLVCGTGALILDSVQLEGRSPLAGKDFASGYLKD